MSSRKKTSTLVTNLIQFIKLQLAGNILFVGTLLGVTITDKFTDMDHFVGLVAGSALAHVVFFYVNKNWIFTEEDNQATRREAFRFVLFMGFNFFLNIFLVETATRFIGHQLPGLTPYAYYIGVVAAAMFFALWSYAGLKLWVFKTSTSRHAKASRHHGLTYEKSWRRRA